MIRFDRKDYEDRVVAALRKEFVDQDAGLNFRGKRITVEDIRIDRSTPRHEVQILFREESRLECLFGFSETAVVGDWDQSPSMDVIVVDRAKGYEGPEIYASVYVATYFEEQVEAVGHGLPPECDPSGITWVTGYRSPVTDWD